MKITDAEAILPGKTTVDEVRSKLGAPSRELTAVSGGRDVIVMLYIEGQPPATRLSVTSDAASKVVSSVGWFPNDAESENNLVKAKARYGHAKFKRRDAEWTNPHAAPDEVFFEDAKLGLKITYLKTPEYVESITWYDPNAPRARRVPTEARPPIKYTIGGQ